jgi:hypothetical protein
MNNTSDSSRLSTWTAKMLQKQADIIRIAQKFQQQHDNTHVAQHSSTPTEFPINSYVLVDYENRPPTKLHTNLRGPMRVVNFVGSRYTVQNLVTNKLEDFHITQLRPFTYDSEVVDPRLVANKDQQFYDVEFILTHQGNVKRKSDLTFLVRWKGYAPSDDSWVKWEDLRNNLALHKYLRDNKLESLIPKKFRS